MNIENLDILINEAIDSQIFPGATIAFGNSKNILYSNAYGYHTYCKKRKTKTDDIFDLASLTKVVATTTAIMMLFSKYGFVAEETTNAKIQFGIIIIAVFCIFAIPLSVKIKNIISKDNVYK